MTQPDATDRQKPFHGVKVIDNQPVPAPTGGAVFTDPTEPGPIHLQGDHTNVKYRDIYLAPVIKD